MRVLAHFLLWNLGLARAETQTSEAERDCLARHAKGRRRLVEVGVWHGVTTCRLRRVMAPDGALDPLTKEMLYLAASMAAGCAYCTASHTAAARAKGMTEAMRGELLAVVGMAAETNRLADALRVPVDPAFDEG